MALRPISKICGATVADDDGKSLGSIVEIMLDEAGGAVAYVVMSFGGTLGVGEKLFAVPWNRLRAKDDGFVLAVDPARLEAADGLDKDAWPTEADALFS